ncbi:MAG: DUF3313 domain-containing protein [Magnetospirillum sp.]|nr:DUF3313 domain-containing protein [Magnetospirillum sp.]
MVEVIRPRLIACGMIAAALAACTSSAEVPAGLSQASQPMQEAPNMPGTLVWKKPGLEPARYTSFIISPVDIYRGSDAHFGDATEADKQALATYTGREFQRALSERYSMNQGAAGQTARLQLTLVGVSDNVPVAATASRIAPVGIVANIANSAAGGNPTFTGTVTIQGQFFDAASGEPIATFVTTRAPAAFDLGATLTSRDAQEAAITGTADDLRDALQRSQTATLPPR